ncbi:MAG: hypothetical protein ACLQHK_13275 [Gallionellaceae bacterium]
MNLNIENRSVGTNTVDWERIEFDYRAGLLTLRDIAAQNGISHTAIAKRAKRDSWERDLAPRILAKAKALVSKQVVSSEVSKVRAVNEQEIVELNAQDVAIRLGRHRTNIDRSMKIALKLLAELEAETDNPEPFAELAQLIIWKAEKDGEVQTKEDVARMTRLQKLFDMAMSNPQRVDSLRKLSETMKTLIGLERQALGLKEDAPPIPNAGIITRIERILIPMPAKPPLEHTP